jgi:hypothetical protein
VPFPELRDRGHQACHAESIMEGALRIVRHGRVVLANCEWSGSHVSGQGAWVAWTHECAEDYDGVVEVFNESGRLEMSYSYFDGVETQRTP